MTRKRLRFIGGIMAIGMMVFGPMPSTAATSRTRSEPIVYTVSLPAPQTQMVDLSIRVPNVTGPTIDFALPVWRPGRYVVLDPAGTVREVRATSDSGRSLEIEKIDKSTWRVTTGGASVVRVDYRVYANSLGDRTRHVDDTHAFLSGSSVFLYVPDRKQDPILIKIDAPPDWKVASGLEHLPGDERTLIAPNYDVLVDSPIEIGLHDRLDFDVDGTPHEIVIWGHADYDADELTTDFATIVEAQTSIFGEMPYERYVFLIHVGAGMGGGTEHLNSTIMQTRRASLEDKKTYKRFLGLVAHEFFHTWNVKQLRPAGIQPYDYAKENYTKLLWVSEGMTSYYTGLTLARTELTKTKDYFKSLADSIGSLRNLPGAKIQSLEESSFDAWIKFNHSTPDSANSTVNFYSKGSLVSLLLDMELRSRTGNDISLDDLMKTMYRRYPLGGGGFTPDDLVNVASELSESDFKPFFASYASGTDEPDFETALKTVGLELTFKPSKKDDEDEDKDDEDDEDDKIDDDGEETEEEDADLPQEPKMKAYIGMRLSSVGGKTTVRSVRSDGPAYLGGVISGDEILAMDGRRLASGDLDKRLKKMEPGDAVALHLMRRDELKIIELILAGKPDGKWTLQRVKEPTDQQKVAYESWLQQDWPEPKEKAEEDHPG
ncbi:MAG: M61 family metallopeptidase [Planctomycetes bacterium]|nr:M61 family metallopeptidase [Planctomycetota bacterium]